MYHTCKHTMSQTHHTSEVITLLKLAWIDDSKIFHISISPQLLQLRTLGFLTAVGDGVFNGHIYQDVVYIYVSLLSHCPKPGTQPFLFFYYKVLKKGQILLCICSSLTQFCWSTENQERETGFRLLFFLSGFTSGKTEWQQSGVSHSLSCSWEWKAERLLCVCRASKINLVPVLLCSSLCFGSGFDTNKNFGKAS